ncbi:hypothetical protein IW148_003264 [Coemansia sp. RSA 1199]|nr:hypothetical protein IW148_003264 [Coemansia sp. RSA 1199]
MALYSKQDLKDSQELYQNCEFISKKTRSIYAWRAALWVRYCKEHNLDYSVTEDKLISYLDWLFKIDLVNKINTKKSYVPDILRDHMGSVICLWRIQTGNNPDLVSPKEGTRYQAKWDDILRNFPRRERFQGRAATQDAHPTEPRASSSGMAISPRLHAGYTPSYGDAPYHHYPGRHGRYQGSSHHPQQQIPPQSHPMMHPPMSPALPSYHNHSEPYPHSRAPGMLLPPLPPPLQQYPAGISESTELNWQIRWTQNLNWRSAAARLIFTTAMAIWVDAVDVTSLRLGDAYFASSTMAPRLPASMLRVVLTTNSTSSMRSGSGGAAGSPSRQQFSIIRARNPLHCPWNALGAMLFYHWHIGNSPPPTFADATWQSSLVLPMQSSDAAPVSAAAMETGFVTLAERIGLAQMLLPQHKLPIERVIRQHSLDRARELASPGSTSGSEHRDPRMPRRGPTLSSIISPLSDSVSLDRLKHLSIANSGYCESHHCIQRHRVLPSESLQGMIFPWATTMQNTVPSNVGIDERRTISRFLDFLLDLRIVILQDAAILRCCAEQLPRGYDTTSMLSHPVFNSLEFARFCEAMQRDAADEIRTLHYDLDKTLGHAGYYDAGLPQHNAGYSAVRSSYGGSGPTQMHPASPAHPDDAAMTIGTPEGESFSPMISPSPPGGAQDMARNSMLFMDIPARGTAPARHTPLGAPQQPMSYSMPNRTLDGWGDGYFNGGERAPSTLATTAGFSANAGSSAHPLAKRLRPGASTIPAPASTTPTNSGSPYSTMSPKTYWRTFHPQRPVKSPTRQSRSPAMSSLGLGGTRGATTTLPSILQFTQPMKVVTSPMLMDAGSIKDGSEEQQSNAQARDTDPIMNVGVRRSSDSTIDDCSGSAMVSGHGEITPSEMEQINSLREENIIMRNRIQRLELSVSQKQAEVQTWMSQIETRIAQSKEQSL